MNDILITGGAGFVGSSIALHMKKQFPNSRVTAIDNLKRSGSEKNLPELKNAGVNFVHGDIRVPSDIEQSKIDLLIDCAAEPVVTAGQDGSTEFVVHTNLLGTYNCLEIARRKKAAVIFLSTSRVYPVTQINKIKLLETNTRFVYDDNNQISGLSNLGISEKFSLEGIRTLYGATKLSSELLAAEYSEMFDIPLIINRCSVLSGPRQMGKTDQGVAVLWMAKHIYQGKLSYIGYGGTGKQVRDILHIDDLLELITIQVKNISSYRGQVFNVGGGDINTISIFELTEMCEKISGNKIEVTPDLNSRAGDIPYYVTDNSKVIETFGWRPKKSLDEIISGIHNWIVSRKEELRSILS